MNRPAEPAGSGETTGGGPEEKRGRIPRLHVVTDDEVLGGGDWRAAAREVLRAGGERIALHIRGARSSGRFLYEQAEALLDVSRSTGGAVIVNDRVDVAMTLPAHGVQLPERSLPVDVARRLLGPARWIGVSVHGAERAASAVEGGADWLVVGTVFATPTHPDRAGGGLALLSQVLAASELPVIAIGGVTAERARAVRSAGAYGVAALGGVWKAADPGGAVRDYLAAVGP